jgi:3-hydroxy-9,10-secoandrosta-1,3,5(10)-triene-9,17-dione monooxygenase reductase component
MLGRLTAGPDEAAMAAQPDVQSRAFRAALGQFATGVTIVTCRDAAGAAIGLTVNSFSALSLAPPLVLWSLRLSSPSLAAFDAASHFAINVLSEAQVDLSRRFAAAVPSKFDEGAWSEGEGGAPLLAGCTATFECERHDVRTGGDHRLFIGLVRRARADATPPLVYHGGRYHLLGEIL